MPNNQSVSDGVPRTALTPLDDHHQHTLASVCALLGIMFPGYPEERLWLDLDDDRTCLRLTAIRDAGPHACDVGVDFVDDELRLELRRPSGGNVAEGVSLAFVRQEAARYFGSADPNGIAFTADRERGELVLARGM